MLFGQERPAHLSEISMPQIELIRLGLLSERFEFRICLHCDGSWRRDGIVSGARRRRKVPVTLGMVTWIGIGRIIGLVDNESEVIRAR